MTDSFFIVTGMSLYIPTGNVRERPLIVVPCMLENENPLFRQREGPKSTAGVIQTKFEWHVHACVFVGRAHLAAAQVMNAILRATYQISDAVKSRRRVISVFWS